MKNNVGIPTYDSARERKWRGGGAADYGVFSITFARDHRLIEKWRAKAATWSCHIKLVAPDHGNSWYAPAAKSVLEALKAGYV